MPTKATMTRITQSRLRRRWRRLAARWVELLWSCPCEYNNISTYRCYGCGARPPREVRAFLATIPMPVLPGTNGGSAPSPTRPRRGRR